MMYTVLESIGTANPPFKRSQSEAARFMTQVEAFSAPLRNRIESIYEHSGIDYRYSCIEDYGLDPEQFEFYPKNWSLQPFPSTEARNQTYRDCAGAIAESAAQQALWQARRDAAEITHLIVVSCTGFSAPGVDIQLIQKLGLASTVDRTSIGFMGCHAAFNGLKVAHAICQSNDRAKVLLVCVELCSLHFQMKDSLENVVINAIFSDGAAAAILTAQSTAEAAGKLAYKDGSSQLIDGTLDLMNWTIGDTGFLMGLSPKVPEMVIHHLPKYLEAFLSRHHLTQDAIDFWAIHPGGRSIVEKIQVALGLRDRFVKDSFEVLRHYGNMSSPTVLFVLKRFLERHQRGLTDELNHGMALAFGPGLSIEGCLFEQVGAMNSI
jgi:alpha-pyrone synthase